jgi:hypothetical protein
LKQAVRRSYSENWRMMNQRVKRMMEKGVRRGRILCINWLLKSIPHIINSRISFGWALGFDCRGGDIIFGVVGENGASAHNFLG